MNRLVKSICVCAITLMCTGCNSITGDNYVKPIDPGHQDSFKQIAVKKDNVINVSEGDKHSGESLTGESNSVQNSNTSKIDISAFDFKDINNYDRSITLKECKELSFDFEDLNISQDIIRIFIDMKDELRDNQISNAITAVCKKENIDMQELRVYNSNIKYDTDYEYEILCLESNRYVVSIALKYNSDVKYLLLDKGE